MFELIFITYSSMFKKVVIKWMGISQILVLDFTPSKNYYPIIIFYPLSFSYYSDGAVGHYNWNVQHNFTYEGTQPH